MKHCVIVASLCFLDQAIKAHGVLEAHIPVNLRMKVALETFELLETTAKHNDNVMNVKGRDNDREGERKYSRSIIIFVDNMKQRNIVLFFAVNAKFPNLSTLTTLH